MRIAIVVSLIIATLAIIFAVINPLFVDIKFLFFTIPAVSLPLVLIVTLILGVVIGYLGWLPSRIALKRKVRSLERERQSATTEQHPASEHLAGIEAETDEK